MSLKPPKYLYLKAKEPKTRIPGFTTIELTNNRKYKPKGYGSEAEWASPADKWSYSWKQVLRLTQTGGFKLKDTKTQSIGKLSEGSSHVLVCVREDVFRLVLGRGKQSVTTRAA